MHVIVLVITVFFYSSTLREPVTQSFVVENPAVCKEAGVQVVAKAEADKEVRFASWACFEVEGGEKT